MPQGPKDLTRRADAIGNAVATGEIDVPAPPADDWKDRAAVARDRRQIKVYFAVEKTYYPRTIDCLRTCLCGYVYLPARSECLSETVDPKASILVTLIGFVRRFISNVLKLFAPVMMALYARAAW
jgi:hypothetical protein